MSRHQCPGCGYVYDERAGHPHEGFPPGTPWSAVPDDWACPDCGVRDKVDFQPPPADGPHAASEPPAAHEPAAGDASPAGEAS